MKDQEGAGGRAATRPFAPRLVRDDDAVPGHPVGLHDPTVREIADSLADLFLGSEGPAAPMARAVERGVGRRGAEGSDRRGLRAAAREARIEMVVLGHLPVQAGAWLTQYAVHAAGATGRPVAVARLDPTGLTIDICGLPTDSAVDRCASVESAIAWAGGRAATWLLRVDDLAEATVAESARIDAITLLSGVSESSIVAAYRALKGLVQRAGGRGEPPARDHPPELTIALLGASQERAREASARVRRAAATFLGGPVGVAVCAERIGPTGARTVYRGPYEGDAMSLIERIGGSVGREYPCGARPESAAMRGTDWAGGSDEDAWLLEPVPARDQAPEGSVVRGLEVDAGEGNAAGGLASGEPCGVSSSAPSGAGCGTDVVAAGGSLSSLLGLTAVPLRCPEAPRVEIAADGSGGLHAVVLDELSDGPGGEAGPGRVGVAALLAAEAWIRANAGLIRRAMPFVRGDGAVLHLVTRVPAAARDLLGTPVKVHLIARASAAGELCVGLN